MRRIVLSVNDNPDYLFYTPLCVWAWKKFAWNPIVLFQGYGTGLSTLVSNTLSKLDIKIESGFLEPHSHTKDSWHSPFRSDTITQTSRLYAASIAQQGEMVMTGDIDMIPLSDYWEPNTTKITVYGYDLTGYTEYPICYLAMIREKWLDVMDIDSNDFNPLFRDLEANPNSKSTNFYEYWGVDQQIATQRIKASLFAKEFINRGQLPNGYATGRIDRGSWGTSIEQVEYIDAHLHRDLYKAFWPDHPDRDTFLKKWADNERMLAKCFPGDDFTWWTDYAKEFAKLTR